MPGSLVFGAATSDVVDFGTPAALQNLDPWTCIAWVYPTTFTTQRNIYNKLRFFRLSGTGGDVQLVVLRATTNTNYVTNSAPLVLNTWNCIAGTFDSTAGAGQIVNIYRGNLATAMTEATYGTATDGSGAVNTDAATAAHIGNNTLNAAAWQGRIAMLAVFAAVLSQAELDSWRLAPRLTVGANVARTFGRGGKDGADWIEYTGLTGTVTGATQGDGPPLGLQVQRAPLILQAV